MIKIIQPGQFGKTLYLLEMHRLRAKIFKERMGWDVNVDMDGLETDDFDTGVTIYLLATDENDKVIGNWRIIPTNNLTMIEKVWPEFLKNIPLKKSPECWEMSRFAVSPDQGKTVKDCIHSFNTTTAEMFCGLTELCILCGIEEIYTMYNDRIAKLLRRLDCNPINISEPHPVNGENSYVGRFIPDQNMLAKIRSATGIKDSLIDRNELPPALQNYKNTDSKEKAHVVA